MLTIDLSFARTGGAGRPEAFPVLETPVSAHDRLAYTASLQSLHTSVLFRLEMDLINGWRLCLDRRFDRTAEEAAAIWNAIELVEKEKARRDPKFAAWLEIKTEQKAARRA